MIKASTFKNMPISHRLIFWGGSIGLFIGLTAIFGWFVGSAAIVKLVASSTPLHFNSALIFVIFGLSFYLLSLRFDRAASLLASLPLVIGCLTLIEHISNMTLGIDEFIVKDFVTDASHFPGRISPNSAVCSVLLSLAILAKVYLDKASRLTAFILVFLGSAVFALGTTASLGYLTGLPNTYGWGNYTEMPIQSAVGFMILGKVITLSSWLIYTKENKNHRLQSLATPITASVFSFALALSYAIFKESHVESTLPFVVLIFGVLLSILTGIMAHLTISSREREEQFKKSCEQLNKEIEIRKKTEADLVAAKSSAERANAEKSRFVAMVSHELRNPLGAILGFSELMGEYDKSNEKYSEIINRNTKNLLDMVDDLLDVAKIEAGKFELTRKKINLESFLSEIYTLFASRTKDRQIDLLFQTIPLIPEEIYTDPQRLRQIFINLISNAIKYNKEGGQVIVTIRGQQKAGDFYLVVNVQDSGQGIPREKVDRLFLPFSRLEDRPRQKGTGLGLNLSHSLAEALGGSLELSWSEPNLGSVFTLLVKVGQTSQLRLGVGYTMNNSTSPISVLPQGTVLDQETYNLNGARVLVVDDSDDIRLLSCKWIENIGGIVDFAHDCRSCRNKLRSGQYDAVLLDIQLPDQFGSEFILKARKLAPHAIFVAYSAHISDLSVKEKARFDACILKPSDPVSIARVLRKFLKIKGRILPHDRKNVTILKGFQKL